jgi:hypothetical protein
MALNIDYDGDIAQTVEDLPRTFTWDGDDYSAVIDPINKQELTDGVNYRDEINFMIVVRTSLFSGDRPQVNDKVTVEGQEYRVNGVEADEADAGLNINIIQVD